VAWTRGVTKPVYCAAAARREADMAEDESKPLPRTGPLTQRPSAPNRQGKDLVVLALSAGEEFCKAVRHLRSDPSFVIARRELRATHDRPPGHRRAGQAG